MKKAFVLFLACALGALVALRADRWFAERSDRNWNLATMTKQGGILPAGTESLPATTPDFRAAAKRIIPSVVSIDATGIQQDWFGNQRQVGDSGSGVIISESGHILTNAHVVSTNAMQTQIRVHLSDGRSFDAKVLGVDRRADLAVLKIDAPQLVPATLGSSEQLEVGEWVLAVGNPFRQDNSVSAGIVGNIGRDVQLSADGWLMDAIQTDASINPGNSGGALTNAKGELVGINTAILSPDRAGSVGIGFAIPIDRAKVIVDDLIKLGRTRYGYVGVQLAGRDGLLKINGAREQYKSVVGMYPPEQGVLVVQVDSGSPAAQAGLKLLDVIQKVDDTVIETRDDFAKATYSLRPGNKIRVTYWSKGSTQTKEIVLGELTNL